MKNQMNKKTLQSGILILVSMLFYLYFAWHDGVVICEDSPTYINMNITREPLYPLLLEIMRRIFGENYLFATVVFQSILAALAAVSIPLFFKREQNISYICEWFLMIIPMGCSLLCRFAAKRASMYSNSILTEGIACSMFLLFTRFLLDYIICRRKRSLFYAEFFIFAGLNKKTDVLYSCTIILCSNICELEQDTDKKKEF